MRTVTQAAFVASERTSSGSSNNCPYDSYERIENNQTMTCVNCGAVNKEGREVCVQCGSILTSVPATDEVSNLNRRSEPPFAETVYAAGQSMPGMPKQLKAIGYLNIVIGPLLAIVNLIVVGNSIAEMKTQNAPEGLSTFLEINIAIYFVVGALLVAGGVGLLLNRKWGRIWSLVAGVSCVLAILAVSIVNNVMKSLLATGALPLHPGQQSFYFRNVAGVAALSPLYGILLIVLLMLPDARAWATRGVALSSSSGEGSDPKGIVVPVRHTSGLAIASLVCSMIPFALLTQIAGLTLGIVALVKIKKSNGALGGRGFAIAGVVISGLIILFIGGILMAVFLGGGFK
jgi:hypothetical protein